MVKKASYLRGGAGVSLKMKKETREVDKMRTLSDNRNGLTVGVDGWDDQRVSEKGKINAEGGFLENESLRSSFPRPLMYSNAKCVVLGLDWTLGETSF